MADSLVIRMNRVIPQKELPGRISQFIETLQNNNSGFLLESIKLMAPEVKQKEFKLPLAKDKLGLFKSELEKFISSKYWFKHIPINILKAPASFGITYGTECSDSSFRC